MLTATEFRSATLQQDVDALDAVITAKQKQEAARGSGTSGTVSTWGPRAAVDILAARARQGGMNAAIYDMHNGDRFELVVSPGHIYDNGKQRVG